MIASVRRTVLTLCTTVALCAAAAAAPVAAQANSGPCTADQASQPFANWNDDSSYVLIPGGDFEGSPAWNLSGSAALLADSEPFAATGTLGSYSLSLPAGGSAQSPATCVDASYQTLRFFVAGSGAALVQVVYRGIAFPVGVVIGRGQWAPSPVYQTGSALFGILSGGSAQVSLRFTALTGDPQIDDVFIDPWYRH